MTNTTNSDKSKNKGGRPRFFDNATKIYSITLPPDVAEAIRVVGGNNLSAGVRKLFNHYMDDMKLVEDTWGVGGVAGTKESEGRDGT